MWTPEHPTRRLHYPQVTITPCGGITGEVDQEQYGDECNGAAGGWARVRGRGGDAGGVGVWGGVGGGGRCSEAEALAERVEELLDDRLLLREPRAAAGDLDGLDTDEGLDARSEQGDLRARGQCEEGEDGQTTKEQAGPDLELGRAPLVVPAVVQEGELDREEDG